MTRTPLLDQLIQAAKSGLSASDLLQGADPKDVADAGTDLGVILYLDSAKSAAAGRITLANDIRERYEALNRLFAVHEKVDITLRRVIMKGTQHIRYMAVIKFLESDTPDIKIWCPNPLSLVAVLAEELEKEGRNWPSSSS